MKISQLAKQLTQSNDRTIIVTIQSLLFLMKKFGKAFNTPELLSFLETSYSDVVTLYGILGKSRCTIVQCQHLLVSVSRLLDHNHLDVVSSLDVFDIDLISGDEMKQVSSPVIGLLVFGKGKVYKRTLDGDLHKLIRN